MYLYNPVVEENGFALLNEIYNQTMHKLNNSAVFMIKNVWSKTLNFCHPFNFKISIGLSLFFYFFKQVTQIFIQSL
jgi:hypothetical protein